MDSSDQDDSKFTPLLVDLAQGSAEWHAWRKEGIGASDAVAILGLGSQSAYQIWEIKTGLVSQAEMDGLRPEFLAQWGNRGKELEPVARTLYELAKGYEVRPCCLQHPTQSHMRASLDGFGRDGADLVVLEIKCPGPKKHAVAKGGKIPPEYIPQLNHLLYVSKATRVDFMSFQDSDDFVVIPYYPDAKKIAAQNKKIHAFWAKVQSKTEPERRFPKVSDPVRMDLCAKIRVLSAQRLELAEQEDALKEELKLMSPEEAFECNGVRMSTVRSIGRVDVKRLAALAGVENVNDFRLPDQVHRKITIVGIGPDEESESGAE